MKLTSISLLIFGLFFTSACSAEQKLKSTYDEKTQATRYEKALTPGISIPFDITKKGNQIELKLKIKEDNGYYFDLEFRYNDPRRSKYLIIEVYKTLYPKKMSQEELDEMNKDEHRVQKLVGYYGPNKITIENGVTKFNETYYPGIPTPIHLIITKIEDDGSKKVVFDKVFEELEKALTGYHYSRRIKYLVLKPGNYQVIAKALKDSPEFIGTTTHLSIYGWFVK